MRITLRPFIGILCVSAPLWLSSTGSAQEPVERARFEYVPPTLLVRARVNGAGPFWFAFDTGATSSLLDIQTATRLRLHSGGRAARQQPHTARARTISVGGAVVRDHALILRDLWPLSARVGRPVAGILGVTWMEQFVFEIDYRASTLTLWPAETELTPAADQLPLPLELHSVPGIAGATLHLPATLEEEHRCAMELDTGAGVGVLGRQLAAALGVDVNPLEADERPLHTVAQLDFAGRKFANVPFRVDARRGADGNPHAQCLAGNELLKEFTVTIDIPRRRAFFRRHP